METFPLSPEQAMNDDLDRLSTIDRRLARLTTNNRQYAVDAFEQLLVEIERFQAEGQYGAIEVECPIEAGAIRHADVVSRRRTRLAGGPTRRAQRAA